MLQLLLASSACKLAEGHAVLKQQAVIQDKSRSHPMVGPEPSFIQRQSATVTDRHAARSPKPTLSTADASGHTS